MNSSSYEQIRAVIDMHQSPRFGHSSSLAMLMSPNREDQYDYINGILSFAFFLFMIFFMWAVLLICFKCLGNERAGCAAGGNILDLVEMRLDPRLNSQVRRIIQRSWRIQTAFFLTAFLIPIASALMLNKGLQRINNALLEIQDINDDIESVAFRAMGVTDSLMRARSNLAKEEILALLEVDSFCPASAVFSNATIFGNMGTQNKSVESAFTNLDTLLNSDFPSAQLSFRSVGLYTKAVDDVANFVYNNDWMIKFFVLVLNVLIGTFFVAICLSRSNYVYFPFHAMLAYLLVPLFCLLLVVASVSTLGFGMVAATNADFCAGGEFPGSPEGTMHDWIRLYNSSNHDVFIDSFEYYVGGCKNENPLHFIKTYQPQLQSSIDVADSLLLAVTKYGVRNISSACGADIQPIVVGVQHLVENLNIIQGNLKLVLTLSDCSTISPILRRIFRGEPCADAIVGLWWMFSSFLAVTLLGLTLLTLRTALYNATIGPPDKERTHKWEWAEYKQYMARHYNDALDWKFHGSPNQHSIFHSSQSDINIRSSEDEDNPGDSSNYSPEIHRPGFRLNQAHTRSSLCHDNGVSLDTTRYITPHKFMNRTARALEDMEVAVRTRGFYADVIDTELQPLEPISASKHKGKTPTAPRKPFRTIQRTNGGNITDSKPIPLTRDLV